MNTIRVKTSRSQVVESIHNLGAVLSGAPGFGGGLNNELARGFALRLGVTCMGFLKPAYVTKAKGGTDEAGEKWAPLAASTIFKRMNKGANKKISQRLRRTREDLKAAQDRVQSVSTFRKGIIAEGKAYAAQEKYNRAADRYAKAQASIEILRDSGRLFNSLSPGTTGQLGPGGFLAITPGVITFGTNVSYAKYHHSDEPRKLRDNGKPILPQRRLWPHPSKWPQVWWNQIGIAARSGAIQAIRLMFTRAA